MLVDRKPDQGIEDCQPVEISLGVVVAGSAEHYLYQAVRRDYQIRYSHSGQNNLIEFFAKPENFLEVSLLATETRKRPGFKVISGALTGCFPTSDQIEVELGETTVETAVGLDLIAAARHYDSLRAQGSAKDEYQAWREYLSKKIIAKRAGVSYVDAVNHAIELILKEYQAAKLEVQKSAATSTPKV